MDVSIRDGVAALARNTAGRVFLLAAASLAVAGFAQQDTEGPGTENLLADPKTSEEACVDVTMSCLADILQRFDAELRGGDGRWQFSLAQRPVLVITDQDNGRIRVMTPVAQADGLNKDQLYRLMQANFGTALDSRYSIADDTVWSVYIHPLSPLSADQLVSAIAQTVTLADTYGSTFSSGALSYGGGDYSSELFEELRQQGTLL